MTAFQFALLVAGSIAIFTTAFGLGIAYARRLLTTNDDSDHEMIGRTPL